jgi:cell division protein FtsQ
MRFMIRQTFRRHRAPIISAAAAAVLLAGGVGVTRSERAAAAWPGIEQRLIAASANAGFRVRAVEVEGRERASAKALLAALGVARGTPIFAVDPAAAKLRLEQVPWVRTASVYRRLPDTLFVTMTEQEPLAFWQRRDHLVLIDRGGRPIATRDLGFYARLPVLVGDDAPANAEALLTMLATEPQLGDQVAAAVRIGARRWNIQFKNGVAVALPEEGADGAWHRLAAIERDHRILERRELLVDLRLPDRIYLKLPPELMPKPPAKKKGHGGDPV